ncbi:MAG: GAF domain-containing sensor histidine kinase, partial [Ignavibacteria bacterium]|nr:GAF domain-containing sensor histidine kinase [Ignavibacteria bacterium]
KHTENKILYKDVPIESANPILPLTNDDGFKDLTPSPNIKQIAKQILEFLLHKINSDVGAIFLFSTESQMLEEIYQTNESIHKGKISIKRGITGLVAKEKEIRFAVSFLNDINYNQEADRPNGFLGETLIFIPLVDDKNNLLGLAQIGSNETMFTKAEEKNIKEHSNYCSKILQQSLNLIPSIVLSSKSELNQISNFIMQDVKAPLLTVKHYSSILSRFDLPDEVKKVIASLSGQTNSIIDLLQASIDFSEKNTKNKLEVINFDDAMNHILIPLSEYVESRNVKLFKKLGCDAKVKIDTKKFSVANYYISRFACDVMKHGGNLYFSSHIEGANAVLTIKDENKFISVNHLEKVFDPAFNNDNDEIIGLSLAISKFIIESMKGLITVQLSDSGTIYLVSIPISS